MSETPAAPPALAPPPTMDSCSGFDPVSRTFYSLRPYVPVPPLDRPLSFPTYALSLLPSPLPDYPALVDADTGTTVTFTAFFSQVRSLSAVLHSSVGVEKGNVAFVLAPACLEIPALYFALFSLGAIVSPANPLSTPSELAQLISLSKPSLAFATSCAAPKLPNHLKVILLDSDDFRSFFSGGGFEKIADVEVQQSDVAAIQFSSGTTGQVKAAAVPHRRFIQSIAGSKNELRPEAPARRSGPEVTLLTAPLFHTMGFFFLLKGVALGDTTVVMGSGGGRRSVEGMLRLAERYQVTQITAAPPMVIAMSRSEEAGRLDLTALEIVICGGAPLNQAAAERFMARFPRVELCQGYGSTETGGVSIMICYEECCHIRSAGRLSLNVEAKIVDNVTGKSLSVCQTGELWIRSHSVMIGYVGDDEANASSFTSDGWLKTGDLCCIDHNGFLCIVDRLKELIKYKGYQVPPAELEHLLQSLPGVADVAVMPYPHEEFGQVPMALIVKQTGKSLSEAEVMDFVAKQVAPYKKIRKVAFIDSIPKNPSGKIMRRELRDHITLGKTKSRL